MIRTVKYFQSKTFQTTLIPNPLSLFLLFSPIFAVFRHNSTSRKLEEEGTDLKSQLEVISTIEDKLPNSKVSEKLKMVLEKNVWGGFLS